MELSQSERFLIGWLAEEDSSALGECKGRDLDALVRNGLARIVNADRGDYARVELTPDGITAAGNGNEKVC